MNIKPIPDNNSNFDKVYLNTIELGTYPYCKEHGAMNKVSSFETGGYWRCCTTENQICRAGCIQVYETDITEDSIKK